MRELGVAQALRQFGDHRHGIHEKAGRTGLPGLHIIRPAYCANAGGTVQQRDEPKPAMFEPEHADVARGLAWQALGTSEMSVHRRAVVQPVALFDSEPVGQKSVTSRRVYKKPGTPGLRSFAGARLDVNIFLRQEL